MRLNMFQVIPNVDVTTQRYGGEKVGPKMDPLPYWAMLGLGFQRGKSGVYLEPILTVNHHGAGDCATGLVARPVDT